MPNIDNIEDMDPLSALQVLEMTMMGAVISHGLSQVFGGQPLSAQEVGELQRRVGTMRECVGQKIGIKPQPELSNEDFIRLCRHRLFSRCHA